MRRLLLALLIIETFALPASADWVQCAGTTSQTCTTSNVGVGTTAANFPLDVSGAGASSSGFQVLGRFNGTASSTALLLNTNQNGGFLGYANIGSGNLANTFFITTGAATIGSGLVMDNAGNVGIGTSSPNAAYKLDVSGNIHASGNIDAAGTIYVKYQDVAEWVPTDEQLTAGTAVVLDANNDNKVVRSTRAYDTAVAGVVSRQPGIVLGSEGPLKAQIATTGRVRIRVDAGQNPIHRGDLLTTSDIPGTAMKSQPVTIGGVTLHRPGTVIGKAPEPLDHGQGEILALLTLQ